MEKHHRTGLGSLLAIFASFGSGVASAQTNPACSTLTNPVYVSAGSANAPLMRSLGKRLAGLSTPRSLVFISTTTCVSLDALVNDTPATGNASYYLADGTVKTCTLPSVTGQVVDVALTGNSAAACSAIPNPLPTTIGDFLGPISVVTIIVNELSTETSISAEALRYIYGMGASTANVAPWNVDAALFRRNETAFTQLYVALAAGLPPTGWFGTDTGTTASMITNVAATGNEQARLGFTTAEVAEQYASTVNVLAYQHTGQTCGYWPDSTSVARDKANVRDGHYWLWGATHWFADVDTGGVPTSAAAADLIAWVQGTATPPEGISFLDATIEAGNVPDCAMRVTRSGDLGALASYAPAEPCGCYFEQKASGSNSCTACDLANPCSGAAEVCRNGFCEAY